MNNINPLKGNQREQLKRLCCDDLGRKVDEIVEYLNKQKEEEFPILTYGDDIEMKNSWDIYMKKREIIKLIKEL